MVVLFRFALPRARVNFFDPTLMVDFVQWGSSSVVGRSSEAITKGIWTSSRGNPDFVPTAGPGQSLAWLGTDSGGGFTTLSADFDNLAPTQGAENQAPVPVEATSWTRVKRLYPPAR